jgi:hypothetical protein
MARPDPTLGAPATSRSRLLLAAGLVLLVQGLSLFAPMSVLGGAIQWPDRLGFPPSQRLPLLRDSIALSTTGIQLWFMALGCLFLWRALRRPA